MLILITDRSGAMDSQMSETAKRKVRFALSRFARRVSSVELVVNDENGPRGGVDKSCRLQVSLKWAQDVVITDRDDDLGRCISRAAERSARAVAKAIERTQHFDRISSAANSDPSLLSKSG
jgi:hypothetical protein